MAEEKQDERHISSAVVSVLAGRREEVARRIAGMRGTEIAHAEGTKLIVVMETDTTGEAGALLATMAALKGVLSANLAFEQAEPAEFLGEKV